MTTTVVGVFNSESAAQGAVNNLRDAGVPMDNISVIARPSGEIVNEQGDVISVDEGHMTAGEGLTVGAVWGGLVGLAALALPGVGPLVTSNIFTAALTGAVAGAATGGIAGALIDAASVPEEHARVYEDRVRGGGTLVSAQVDDSMAAQARTILQTAGSEEFNWDDPSTFAARADRDMNRLDEAGYVAGGIPGSDEQAYAESSKVGTVGGGAAGALTGAAIGAAGGPIGAVIGGVAGAITGGAVGAVGDTIGEHADDAVINAPSSTTSSGYVDAGNRSDDITQPNYAPRDTGHPVRDGLANAGNAVERATGMDINRDGDVGVRGTPAGQGVTDRVEDAVTDDQGRDTFKAADQAYDASSKVGTGGGAVAGAVTGAAIGSVGGPLGTAAGAVAGAIAGGAAGAVGDTIGQEADTNTGAFSPENKAQYGDAAQSAEDKLRDAGNAVERGTDADLDRDGDVGKRY